MAILTFEGRVEYGRIRLIDEARLPEQTRVYVIVPDLEAGRAPRIRSPHLVHPEQAADFSKTIVEVLPDAKL